MGIAAFYFISLIPIGIACVLMLFNRRVVWWEWLIGAAAGLLVSAIMHVIALVGMTSDVETWSGQVERVVFYPRWVEEYQQMHTRIVGSGKHAHTQIYYTTEHRTHSEHWAAQTTLGEFDVSQSWHDQIAKNLGGKVEARLESKLGFHSGDHNIYLVHNTTGWLQPVTDLRSWSNKVKACPSVFSFAKVPANAGVHLWPENSDRFHSERAIGLHGVDLLELDRLNARLGPSRHVNIIIIGFATKGSEVAEWQRAAWTGGKKNDLVICFGGNPKSPTWAKVFGWSESELCKRNIESIVLGGMSNDALMKIGREVVLNYKPKDWKKFDYLTIDPPTWSYVTLIITMIVTQAGWWWFAINNEESKS